MAILVTPVSSAADRRAFLNLPRRIYANEKCWIEPLRVEIAQRLNPRKNSYLRRAEVTQLLARRAGDVVGRITAQIDRGAHGNDATEGSFGFYEAVDDEEVGVALFEAAESWLRARGITKIVGPYNFRLEDPAPGFLAHGFEHKPTFMMPYSMPYYLDQAKRAGFSEVMRLKSYSVSSDFVFPDWIKERVERAWKIPELKVRPFDMKNLYAEAEIIRNIFNVALRNNWGYVPFSKSQVRAMARELKFLADPEIILLAEVGERPVGVVINLPNFNDIFHDCRGRLFPKGLYRMLFRKRDIVSMRGYAFAILPEYQSRGLGVLLIAESWRRCIAAGYTRGEITWILGSNSGMNELAEGFGGNPEKEYSLVEKHIGPDL